MANAATNSGLTLSQLTDVNARLSATTSTQYQNIKKLLKDIKISSSSPNPRSSSTGVGAGATGDQQTIKLLQAAIKNRWIVGDFYSSHGWGVGHLHSSSTCNNNMTGHVDTATRKNPAGPGATRNQDWDDFT